MVGNAFQAGSHIQRYGCWLVSGPREAKPSIDIALYVGGWAEHSDTA